MKRMLSAFSAVTGPKRSSNGGYHDYLHVEDKEMTSSISSRW